MTSPVYCPLATFLESLKPLFNGGTPASPIVIAGLIVLMVVLALLCQASLWWRYGRIRANLDAVYNLLPNELSFQQVSAAVTETIGVNPRGSGAFVAWFFNRAVRRGEEFQPVAAVEIARDRERQLWRFAFARWITGTALVMGLLGTFVAFTQLVTGSGLLEALETLHDAPSSVGPGTGLANSYAQLSTAFTHVYAGFGYAFLASITGLVGTMALGFVNMIFVARALACCLAHLEDFSEDILRPLLAPADRRANELANAIRNATTVLQTTGDTMVALRDTTGILEQVALRFDETERTNSGVAATLAKLASEIEASRERWETLLEALRESRGQIARSVEEFRNEAAGQRELTNRSTAETVTGMRSVVSTMAKEIQNITAAKADHFASVQTDVQRMLVESKKDWDRVSSILIGKTEEGFKLSLNIVQSVIEDGRNDAAAAQQQIAGLARDTAAVVSDHQRVLSDHAQAVTDSLRQWGNAPEQLAAVVEGGRSVLEKLTGTLDALGKMPENWERRVLGPIKDLDAKLTLSKVRGDDGPWLNRRWSTLGSWLHRRWSTTLAWIDKWRQTE